MENPATWGPAEKIIAEAIGRHDQQQRRGFCGLSLPRQIADALRSAGLLKDEER